MVDSVFMAELSWPEFAAKIAGGAPVFLPLGSTEQHGYHMSLNVDVVLPTAVCERVAKAVGGIVAPTVAYGCKSMPRSGGGEAFPGTIGLDAHTYALVLRDVIRGLGRHGVKRLVLVSGHYENAWPTVEGLELGLRELRHEGIEDIEVIRCEYWDFVHKATLERVFAPRSFPGIDLEHASLLETSLMLALRPELVETDKYPDDGPAEFPPYDRWPTPEGFGPASGVLALAQGSSAEKGNWLLDDHVALMAAAVKKEFGI